MRIAFKDKSRANRHELFINCFCRQAVSCKSKDPSGAV